MMFPVNTVYLRRVSPIFDVQSNTSAHGVTRAEIQLAWQDSNAVRSYG